MIPRLAFASCYVYSPAGSGRVSRHSRLLREFLKAADARFIDKYALRVQQQVDGGSAELRGYIEAEDILVPVPGSAAMCAEQAWVARRLAEALVAKGLGRVAWPGLRRVSSVRKSAYALIGARPSVHRHYDSFSFMKPKWEPQSIVLVDDIVTKGRTLLAAAARIQDVLPHARIKAFALMRTRGLECDVATLLEPCRGEINWSSGDARRNP
jgi:predicted amidophosphoribosyltransferase